MPQIMKPTSASRWERLKDALKEGLNRKRAAQLDIMLENTRKDFVKRTRMVENATASATSIGNIATLNKVILPIIRRVMPNVIANELIGVQPMPGPTAQITTERFVYANVSTGSGVFAGQEALTPLHIHDIAAAYSGNEVMANPAAASTAALESVPGNGMKLEILKQLVQCGTRKLSARWTQSAAADLSKQYQLDIEEEMGASLAQTIISDIDQEILRSLRKLPSTPTAANTFDQNAVTGQPNSVADVFAALPIMMSRQANLIATRTRMGRANWAVVSPAALTMLEAGRASALVRTTEGNFEAPNNSRYVGTLNNSLKIYTDMWADDDTPILLGYKGTNEQDAATFYCPYVPLTSMGTVVDPETFDVVTSLCTRYAYVEFVNSATSLGNSADYLGLVGINADNMTFY